MPLVPPASSSLFRPISDDKPWHTLLSTSIQPQSSSTITPPDSALSQQSPPPSPPRISIASSTSTSSISVSLVPPPPISPQYHTSASSGNNQSTYSAPSKDTCLSLDDNVSQEYATTQTPSPPHVVRFTAEHVTIGSTHDAHSRKLTACATPDLAFASEDEFSFVKPKNEFVRIRPTHKSPPAVEQNSSMGTREDGVVIRDQNDLLADLQDLSNMLTDHIDVTKGFIKNNDRGRRSGSRFIKRILSKVRPVRVREREKVVAEQAAVVAAAEATVKGDIHYSSGIRNASDELRQLVRVEDDVYGDYDDDLDDDCWSESELQTLSTGKRQYLGFTKRNDTDIETMQSEKCGPYRGRSSRLHGEAPWLQRGGRRRSIDLANPADESGRLQRMSRSTVVVGKDWEDLRKGRSRLRLRMKGSHMDRRADRSEVDGRGGDVWGRWKEDMGWGREPSVTSLPVGDLGKEFLARGEHSFRSADSSVGALSVSSITQASRSSSVN